MITAKKKTGLEVLLHLVFWAGVFYVLTSLDSRHILTPRKSPFTPPDQKESVLKSTYVYCILIFLALLFYGNTGWIFRKAIRYRRVTLRLVVCAIWFAVVFCANFLVVGPLFDRANHTLQPPPKELRMQIDPVIKEDAVIQAPKEIRPDGFSGSGSINFMITSWKHLQPVILLAFLVIQGISIAYFFLKEWTKNELLKTQLRAEHLGNEVRFLKSQINPHFLFNTLNNLFSMAQDNGNDKLADGIHKLSGIMSYMLYDSDAATVPFATEIGYLEEFITLSKLRYADEEAKVVFQYPSQTAGIAVAPMLFVPFVENAFKHGVSIGQAGTILIGVTVLKNTLVFTCENSNRSAIKKTDREKSGIGLDNVKRRLQLLYPGKHKLQLNATPEKYTVYLEINLA